jgi:hypothetical protein
MRFSRTSNFSSHVTRFAFCLFLTICGQVQAATMNYVLNGGDHRLTGTLNGTSFTNASYALYGTGDTANLTSGALQGTTPYFFIPMTVTMEITEGSTVYTMTLLPSSGNAWGAVSLAFPGFGAAGFATLPMNHLGVVGFTGGPFGGSVGIYNNLSSPGRWEIPSNPNIFGNPMLTNLGDLLITAGNTTFNMYWEISNATQAVPEPSSMAIFGLSALGLACRARRQKRG